MWLLEYLPTDLWLHIYQHFFSFREAVGLQTAMLIAIQVDARQKPILTQLLKRMRRLPKQELGNRTLSFEQYERMGLFPHCITEEVWLQHSRYPRLCSQPACRLVVQWSPNASLAAKFRRQSVGNNVHHLIVNLVPQSDWYRYRTYLDVNLFCNVRTLEWNGEDLYRGRIGSVFVLPRLTECRLRCVRVEDALHFHQCPQLYHLTYLQSIFRHTCRWTFPPSVRRLTVYHRSLNYNQFPPTVTWLELNDATVSEGHGWPMSFGQSVETLSLTFLYAGVMIYEYQWLMSRMSYVRILRVTLVEGSYRDPGFWFSDSLEEIHLRIRGNAEDEEWWRSRIPAEVQKVTIDCR